MLPGGKPAALRQALRCPGGRRRRELEQARGRGRSIAYFAASALSAPAAEARAKSRREHRASTTIVAMITGERAVSSPKPKRAARTPTTITAPTGPTGATAGSVPVGSWTAARTEDRSFEVDCIAGSPLGPPCRPGRHAVRTRRVNLVA